MNIIAAAHDLKQSIQIAASLAIAEFVKETGVCPSGIQIRFVETTTHADPVKSFTVSGIEVEIKL